MTDKNRIENITNCTGCGACRDICPYKAILMEVNEEGFLYPKIDSYKCINCGLCYDNCPSEHPIYINSNKPDCLAMSANDELRKESSSGAIFPLLAEYVLNQGGYVCGAVWAEENLVEHTIISDKADLYKLKSSKYIQSDTKDVYKEIKELLKSEKLVLFSGTPCQVAGLNAYLRKQYDNLITVDIVCHGVPSPKVYKKYIQELVQNDDEKVIKTNFRDKTNGWNPYLITTETNNSTYTIAAKEDKFMKSFLENLCLRDSCAKCPFAKFPRQGDITLGDFWGIHKYSKKLNDGKGLSLVLPNSSKGNKYINAIKEQTKLCKKIPIKYAIKGNPCLVKSSVHHHDREGFFERLKNRSLIDNIDITLGNKYDCAILNFWFTNNYGALLTCYALQETIKLLGLVPKVINYVPPAWFANFYDSMSFDFASKYLNLTELCKSKNDLKNLNEKTDVFIAGSDQIWRYPYFWYHGANIFQFNFVNSNKIKLAYAVSFGTDYFEGNDNDTQLTKYYIQQFDNISVREDDGVDICNNTFEVDATHVLDPVFLTSMQSWNKIINNSNHARNNFIASYVLDKSISSNNILNSVKKHFSDIKSIDMGDGSAGEKTSVEDWLYTVKNCQFFVTDSFHGACFAIIFNKPFICIANKARGFSRFKSLFKMFGLENKCIVTDNINITDIISQQIDWCKINKIKENEVKKSKKWLIDALNVSIKEKDPTYDVIEQILSIQEILRKQIELPKLKKRFNRYRLLSKICFGKKRKKYKQKKLLLKQEIKMLEG